MQKAFDVISLDQRKSIGDVVVGVSHGTVHSF